MDDGELERIFDEGYSTGDGDGMGMGIVRGLVQKAGAKLDLANRDGGLGEGERGAKRRASNSISGDENRVRSYVYARRDPNPFCDSLRSWQRSQQLGRDSPGINNVCLYTKSPVSQAIFLRRTPSHYPHLRRP